MQVDYLPDIAVRTVEEIGKQGLNTHKLSGICRNRKE